MSPHAPRRLLVVLVAALLGVTLMPSRPAAAEPSVAEIEAQIQKTWEQLEPLVEQYNRVHSSLKANQKKSAELRKKIAPLELQVDLALSRVGVMAAKYYKSGTPPAVAFLVSAGGGSDLAEQLVMLDQVARGERRQIAAVSNAKGRFDGEKRKVDALIAEQRKQDAELAARKKTIDIEMDRLQRLRIQAYGTSTVGGSLRIGACPALYIGGKAGTAAKSACSQIGKPYRWGASGPGSFDCSGLTQYAWGKAGVSLTHYTGAQWREGDVVSRANARPGDLVFFYGDLHHVGMYVGNGLMVHAPHSGDVVRMARVSTMPVQGYRRPG